MAKAKKFICLTAPGVVAVGPYKAGEYIEVGVDGGVSKEEAERLVKTKGFTWSDGPPPAKAEPAQPSPDDGDASQGGE